MRFWSLGDVTRIAIEVSSDFHYRSDRLNDPERIFFDIHGAKPEMVHKGMHVINVGDALLKQIRVAETNPGVTRIVLDLEQAAEFTASQLSRPDRLMIEIRKESPAPPSKRSVTASKSITESPLKPADPDVERELPAPMSTMPVAAVVAKPEPRRFQAPPEHPAPARVEAKPVLLSQPALSAGVRIPKAPGPAPAMPKAALPGPPRSPEVLVAKNMSAPALPSFDSLQQTAAVIPVANKTTANKPDPPSAKTSLPEPAPAKRNANGERSLTRVLGLKLGRVVIDPGHGGHDMGTHGTSGSLEKEVVLDVAKRVGALLEDRLGSEVIYTRTDDTFIPLERRTQIANEGKADLFLSIHANSSPYKYVAGVETYYLNFTTIKSALDTATRENATSSRSVFELKDLLQKIALKDKIDESREFAARVESALYGVSSKSNPAAKNRGVKKAPFVVLIGASMPSVLAEIGFLTNTNDELMLKRPDHRQKIAEALYKGISNYADTLSHYQVARRE
ncbi:MAG TPA: N-acetylmuramoyl-L-alanine amidase [Bryobacteraceae bacterium]|nr:N-acetylmuramoyl-L-alanine amidase [Bryobacteraceae bacterium]